MDVMTHPKPVSAICGRIVDLMKTRATFVDDPNLADWTIRLEMQGEIHGLREALCLVQGWPVLCADVDGRADQFVRDWHNKRFPDEEPW